MNDTVLGPAIPALLFPAISLLFLAYTNRFLGLTAVARGIMREHLASPQPHWEVQLINIRRRLKLIRTMQVLGLGSILLAAISMGLLAFRVPMHSGEIALAGALICLVSSLAVCVHEIKLSIDAIEVEFRRANVPEA